jgi:hypothetical protein
MKPPGTDQPSKGGIYAEGAPRLGRLPAWVDVSLCATAIAPLIPAAAQAAKPAYLKGHPYRHGAVPFRGHSKLNGAPAIPAASANNLTYQGDVHRRRRDNRRREGLPRFLGLAVGYAGYERVWLCDVQRVTRAGSRLTSRPSSRGWGPVARRGRAS